jgi:hypothetical protein
MKRSSILSSNSAPFTPSSQLYPVQESVELNWNELSNQASQSTHWKSEEGEGGCWKNVDIPFAK